MFPKVNNVPITTFDLCFFSFTEYENWLPQIDDTPVVVKKVSEESKPSTGQQTNTEQVLHISSLHYYSFYSH